MKIPAKEKFVAIASTGTGPLTAGVSLNELNSIAGINDILERTTPIITYLGLVFGMLLSLVMLIYWIQKLLKNEKEQCKQSLKK